uniref:Uncharacterized protein n=1 Tax=Tetraselmis sp. GSL018 TaxID=582737 RepID=A0A061RGN4_9CHLO
MTRACAKSVRAVGPSASRVSFEPLGVWREKGGQDRCGQRA